MDEEDSYEPWPRDVAIDATKEKFLFEKRLYKVFRWITGKLLQFFDERPDGVYYDTQLRV